MPGVEFVEVNIYIYIHTYLYMRYYTYMCCVSDTCYEFVQEESGT